MCFPVGERRENNGGCVVSDLTINRKDAARRRRTGISFAFYVPARGLKID